MSTTKATRLQQWLQYRVRVTMNDFRVFVGTFMAFDRHFNLVLADCEEFRRVKAKGSDVEKEVKRHLGMAIIRGDVIMSLTAEAPPPATEKKPGEGLQAGSGRGQAAGRGVNMTTGMGPGPGMSGPGRGVGGPAIMGMRPPPGAGMAPPPGMR